ncbi:sensor histidine kinase [Campylobacter sputorum]|uniref:sensor histidine kinase n=1 Tax=Campylobacter sputorum TaxID=206 RepID=UPI001E32FB0B|nr:sensor histidine kinase [Campylobacter sputorum]
MYKKFISKPHFKFYLMLLIITIVYFCITIISFIKVSSEVGNIGENFTSSLGIEISNSITAWLSSQSDSVTKKAEFIEENSDILRMPDKISKHLNYLHKNDTIFDIFQLYLDKDKYIYVNNEKEKIRNLPFRENTLWYKNTMMKEKTTINVMDVHRILNIKSINICSPIHKNGEKVAVFCGVINADEMLKKIIDIKNTNLQYLFLIDTRGDISGIDDEKTKDKISSSFLKNKKTDDFKFTIDNITFFKIPDINWFVGISIDKERLTQDSFNVLIKNANFVFIGFFILTILGNLIYNKMLKKLQIRQKEYEVLLQKQLQFSRSGELVANISHQLKEPLNSISIILSSTVFLKNENKLSDEQLKENLALAIKSTTLMANTIDTIRNFYKYSDYITQFNIYQSISNLLKILSVHLKSKNVNINLNCDKNLVVRNKETFLQQILLILIQNAKDALIQKHKQAPQERIINIDVSFDENFVYILVKDFGIGISEELSKKIFSSLKLTSKRDGSAIGLYFAKKTALYKLGGNLELISLKNPTTFELKIKR